MLEREMRINMSAQHPETESAPDQQQGLVACDGSGHRSERPRGQGFGAARMEGRQARRQAGSKRRGGLSKAERGPLGKHPPLEAIVARQRLRLPRSGRLSVAQVNQAWKRCAAEHHPDRGGEHETMQRVNAARDLLLGN